MTRNDEVLKPIDVAEILGISRSTAYEAMRTGRIPCYQIGTARRVRRSTLERWMDEQEARRS